MKRGNNYSGARWAFRQRSAPPAVLPCTDPACRHLSHSLIDGKVSCDYAGCGCANTIDARRDSS